MSGLHNVAICIPTYNQAPYLDVAVRSALAQTHPCEVWVSDDASADETPAVMASLLKEHPLVRHFRQKNNLGIKENPTWVMKQTNAEFIVRLDSDDILKSDYVQKLLDALVSHPQAGYAHAAIEEIGEDGHKRRLRLLARQSGFQTAAQTLEAAVSGYRVAANICMFRRAALRQVGYYRDLSFGEDWDLAVRLADFGWGNLYINEVLAKYRVWDTPVRSRRKLAEVEGCRRVIEESLVPAFMRRGWKLSPISKKRRQLALCHAECLRSKLFTEAEQKKLEQALCLLGDSLTLRWKFRWIRTPLAPLFEVPKNIENQARTWIKSVFFKGTKTE